MRAFFVGLGISVIAYVLLFLAYLEGRNSEIKLMKQNINYNKELAECLNLNKELYTLKMDEVKKFCEERAKALYFLNKK